MLGFDNHRYCYKCREASKGDDLCTLKKDCLLCIAFSEDQKRKLTEKILISKLNFYKLIPYPMDTQDPPTDPAISLLGV